MKQNGRDLNWWFDAYRNACQAPEAGSDFMPGIWRRVDARRGSVRALRRWTGAFIAVSATLSVLMMIYMSVPVRSEPVYSTTYVDTFEQVTYETLAYSEIGMERPPEAADIP